MQRDPQPVRAGEIQFARSERPQQTKLVATRGIMPSIPTQPVQQLFPLAFSTSLQTSSRSHQDISVCSLCDRSTKTVVMMRKVLSASQPESMGKWLGRSRRGR